MPPPGTWAPECLGELPLVNGALYPYLEVEPRAYRFRVVNAANQRFFELFLNLAKDPIQVPSLVNVQQIGGMADCCRAAWPFTSCCWRQASVPIYLSTFQGMPEKL